MTQDRTDPPPRPYVPRHARPDEVPRQRKSFPAPDGPHPAGSRKRRNDRRFPQDPDDTGDIPT